MRRYWIFPALLLLLAGCAALVPGEDACGDSPEHQAEPARLNRKWLLVDAPFLDSRPIGRPVGIFLEFSGDKVGGFAGVNRFFGSYRTSGRSLSMGTLGSTMMTGSHAEFEAAFLKALRETDSFEIAHNRLKLFCGARLLAVFDGAP